MLIPAGSCQYCRFGMLQRRKYLSLDPNFARLLRNRRASWPICRLCVLIEHSCVSWGHLLDLSPIFLFTGNPRETDWYEKAGVGRQENHSFAPNKHIFAVTRLHVDCRGGSILRRLDQLLLRFIQFQHKRACNGLYLNLLDLNHVFPVCLGIGWGVSLD